MLYMQKVRAAIFWVPKYHEVMLRPCPEAPSKELLFSELSAIAAREGFQLGIDSASQVNTEWLLNTLSTLNPEHQIFSKSYRPEKAPPKNQIEVDNRDGFFDGLPL